MKLPLVLLLCVAASSALPRARLPWRVARRFPDGRIIGGSAVDITSYPWQVSQQYLGLHDCGGSVISSNWVLTAAHCLDGFDTPSLTVRAGTSTVESGGVVFSLVSAQYHESFDYSTADYDIGVMQIDGTFTFGTTIQTVSLATSELAAGEQVTITGWGSVDDGSYPTQLQAVTTAIWSRDACNVPYGGSITERMICAGEQEGGRDACSGDSGGPLVQGSTQYGIVSWGYGCAQVGTPGVYSNVANLRSWVSDVTGV